LLPLGLLLTLVIFWTSLRGLEYDVVRIYAAMVLCLSVREEIWMDGIQELQED
jgi:hypothetical protein